MLATRGFSSAKRMAFLVILAFLLASTAAAQPDTLWTRTYGGSQGDWGYSVQQTTDGGFVIVGTTRSFGSGSSDVLIIKTNEDGSEEWSQTFGGSDQDKGFSVLQSIDGGYIIAGSTKSYGLGGIDAWLIKTDFQGDEEWSKTFGGGENDLASSIQLTTDGGYIITGYTCSYGDSCNVWLIKTDTQGNEAWSNMFGGTSYDRGNSVSETEDGGYIITGATYSYGSGRDDVWLIKTDRLGNEEWEKTFGSGGWDGGNSVKQTSDGGFIVTGRTSSYGLGESDIWLIKTDFQGNEEWNEFYGEIYWENGMSVQQAFDGGFIITGVNDSRGDLMGDLWVLRTNDTGDSLWSVTFGGNYYDIGYEIESTSDGGYILVGTNESENNADVYLIRLASEFSPDLSVSIPDLYVEPAETLWVPVDVSNTSGYEIHSSEFTLTYDSTFTELLDVDFQGALPTTAGWLIERNPVPGSLRVAMSGDTPLSGEGTLANIRFAITGDTSGVSSTQLFLSPFLFNEGDPAVQVVDGSLTVGTPGLSLNPETISFGTVQVGQFAVDSLVISNTGTGDLEIFSITWNDTVFDIDLNSVPDFLPPGSNIRLDVFFTPRAQQLYSDLITVSTNAGDGTVILVGNGIIVGVEPYDAQIPTEYALEQNYPNPFNPVTEIRYALPVASKVILTVYNVQGREVVRLVDVEQSAGYHRVIWNASKVASGIYFYCLQAGDFIQTRKMLLLK